MQAMKISMKIYVKGFKRRYRDRRTPRRFPLSVRLAQVSPLISSFPRFWTSVMEIEVLNDCKRVNINFKFIFGPQMKILT